MKHSVKHEIKQTFVESECMSTVNLEQYVQGILALLWILLTGCGKLWVKDGIWKLTCPHCMYRCLVQRSQCTQNLHSEVHNECTFDLSILYNAVPGIVITGYVCQCCEARHFVRHPANCWMNWTSHYQRSLKEPCVRHCKAYSSGWRTSQTHFDV